MRSSDEAAAGVDSVAAGAGVMVAGVARAAIDVDRPAVDETTGEVLMFNESQVSAYLERIGYEGDVVVCKETLDALTFCHQKSVPFETYDVHVCGVVPALSEEALYEKIVVRRRGGYCFELNKCFETLLSALGFEVRPVLSRAVRGRDTRMPINHRGMLVKLDGVEHTVDVGFGGPMPAGSLRMVDGEEQCVQGEYYTPRKMDESWWAIDRITRAGKDFFDDGVPERKQTELEVSVAIVEDIDFNGLNVAFAQPGVLFRDHLVCNLRTDKGHYALMDDKLTVRNDGEKSVVVLEDKEEQYAALKKYFGIVVRP